MKKSNLVIIILTILLTASSSANVILEIRINGFRSPISKNVLKMGVPAGRSPEALDPIDIRYSESKDVIRHVCDTLWVYDLTDPNLPLKLRLATNYSWNIEMDELTVSLRNGVWFHDGTKFNATAVKFTFDRITYFINASGSLPSTSYYVCYTSYLFFDMNNEPILNRTEIIDEYTIKLILNHPNGVFIALLCYEACSIVSPESTPATENLLLSEDILVGTGPFEYIHFIAGEELRIERFDLYWGFNTFWDYIIWEYYPDTTSVNNAFLDGKFDYLKYPLFSFIPEFKAHGEFHFVEMNTSTIFRYWAINNNEINNTNIRKAIAYAYNYSYFIEKTLQGGAIRAEQILPPGFLNYNSSFKAPYYNTSIARLAMKEAFPIETAGLTLQAYGENFTNDAAWAALTLVIYQGYDYEGWIPGMEMIDALNNDMDKIGIYFETEWDPWDIGWWSLKPKPWECGIWYTGWSPNYLDPFNMLAPILSNKSSHEYANIRTNDYLIDKWLRQYEKTDPTNITRRAELIFKIQQRAINELYLLLPICFDKTLFVHHRSLGGVSYNILGNLWLADSYFIPGIQKA
ncbi:MAG: ABC transporter substrate-binding protein [Promethearchaeota archaeon]